MKNSIRRKAIIIATFVLQLSTLCFHAHAAPGDVDLSFDPGSGVDGTVRAVALQSDGKLIVGGRFRTVKGLMRTGVARLNADGSGDSSFAPGTGAYEVYSVALQPYGKVLIGGAFSAVNGTARAGIARLNSDGSLDAAFNPGTQSGAVYSIAVMPTGQGFIGGTFTKVNGTHRGGIALLNPDGSLDTGFDPGPAFYSLNSIMPLADGKVYVAGIAPPLWRLNADGSRDMTFDPDWRAMGEGFSVTTQPDGKVLIANAHTSSFPNGILRLNSDGTPDSSFQPATGLESFVHSVSVQSDGKLLIAGYFTTGGGTDRNGIARLNPDGSVDSGFAGLVQPIYPHDPTTIALQPDGKVIIGGAFLTVSGTARHRLARLNSNGSPDNTFDPGTGVAGYVHSLARQPDGKLLAGGRGMDRLNRDGSRDNSFNGEFTPSDSSGASLASLALQPDGKVLLAAKYDGIIRLNTNGSRDSGFQPAQASPSSFSNLINAVVAQTDGRILVAGNFFELSGSPRHNAGRLNANGSLDHSFLRLDDEWDGGNFTAMVVQPDGKVVVGGLYFEINAGALAGYVRRFHPNGDADNGFTRYTAAANSAVRSLALQPDGKLLVGGSAGDTGFLVRLLANGTTDAGFNPATDPNGPVQAIAVQSNGKVLLGGDFTGFNAVSRNRIARLHADGSLDIGFNPGTGFDGNVSTIMLQPNGDVLAGGSFLTVNGVLRPYVARLHGDSVLPLLSIARSGGFAILSWPSTTANLQLQETTDLTLPDSWSAVAQPAVTNGDQISVTVLISAPRRFFRLERQ
jgi:uncharacterized delta-60 repeat protein